MKKLNFIIPLFILAVLFSAGLLVADWYPEDGHKMHWPQEPDLTVTGMDVSMSWPPLADDFQCAEDGPITDIHIWGSFLDDELPFYGPNSLIFQIAIYDDIPEEEPIYKPQVLADDFECFEPGPITDIHIWGSWLYDYVGYGPDMATFTLSIHEDIPAAQSPTGYSMPGALVWKKIFTPGEFDVFTYESGLQEGFLIPCEDPPFYEPFGDSICFQYNFYIDPCEAFIQEGTPLEPKVYWLDVQAVPIPEPGFPEPLRFGWKTSYNHWNDNAVYGIGEDPPADWFELYYPMGHQYELQPIDLAFAITSYDEIKYVQWPDLEYTGIDVDATMELTYSRPGEESLLITTLFPGDYTVREVDTLNNEDWFDPVTGWWSDDNHRRAFQYNFPIENTTFEQEAGNIYWLVIGYFIPPEPDYTFGWKTTQTSLHFQDDAVYTSQLNGYWYPLEYPPGHEYEGQTCDLAFVINGGTAEPDLDFGDAPQPNYPTKLDADGARHTIVPGILLGGLIDGEGDGQPDATATGDDIANQPDEDGVTFTTPIMPGTWASVDISASVDGYINAWLDFNGDGDWDDLGEQILTDYFVNGALVNTCSFPVPYYAQPGIQTFARFRYTTYLSGAAPINYTGLETDGEVEDYMVDIEENPLIKWIQLPDLSPNGINIKVDDMMTIADDFECTRYGLITDVHFWGSWKYDEIGVITNIHLSIHSDDPCGEGGSNPDNEFSMPDKLLWERDFSPNEFYLGAEIMLPDGEYWWNPTGGELIPEGDHIVQRIDIYIPEEEAFKQEGSEEEPVIYWLDIKVETEEGFEFGWKTRRFPDHFMDDAVFYEGSELPPIWEEMRYPPEHPYDSNSIDMAFIITGKDLKRPIPNLKWSQPPIEIDPCNMERIYCGWNEESWTQDPCDPIPNRAAADDFRCLGSMPVTSIHWWGSFIGWDFEELPMMQPESWNIKFYENIPEDPGGDPNYSHPGNVLWEIDIPNSRVETAFDGWDEYHEMPFEACFQHYVELEIEEYFLQDDYNEATFDNIYWIGITAVYPEDLIDIENPWGWKTRPAHWMDDAVKYECRIVGEDPPGVPIIECRFWPIEDYIFGESFDLAFELDTDPNYIKWEQPFTGIRDWPHYEDVPSMADETASGELDIHQKAADDWPCEHRTPVTAITWWGSYLGYRYYTPCYGTIMPPPTSPDYFVITIHKDVPANDPDFSHPGEMVWDYIAYDYDEVFVGYDKDPRDQFGPPREPVYRYSVRLPEDDWFEQRKYNEVYWVSIMAVYKAETVHEFEWGWTIHKHVFNDDGVIAIPPAAGPGGPDDWTFEEIYDQTGESADMSFTLFTDPTVCVECADYDFSGLVNFKDFAVFALDWLWTGMGGGYANGDLDCDGDVDYADLQNFANQWLTSCP